MVYDFTNQQPIWFPGKLYRTYFMFTETDCRRKREIEIIKRIENKPLALGLTKFNLERT